MTDTDTHHVKIAHQEYDSKSEQNNRSNRSIVIPTRHWLSLRLRLDRNICGLGHVYVGRHIGIGSHRWLRFLQAKQLVQAKRVRGRQAKLLGLGRLVSFKRHVNREKTQE